jgi:hypothetical protein
MNRGGANLGQPGVDRLTALRIQRQQTLDVCAENGDGGDGGQSRKQPDRLREDGGLGRLDRDLGQAGRDLFDAALGTRRKHRRHAVRLRDRGDWVGLAYRSLGNHPRTFV